MQNTSFSTFLKLVSVLVLPKNMADMLGNMIPKHNYPHTFEFQDLSIDYLRQQLLYPIITEDYFSQNLMLFKESSGNSCSV